jgi:DNA-binding response OmpR family regulator
VVPVKRRILLVDDDLAVLLTLKAVLEFQGFEVDSANSSAEAFSRLQSGVYHMVISDLRMETEDSGLKVLRAARRQSYNPATALLTAYPPDGNQGEEDGWSEEYSDSLLIKPLGINDLLRQVEALLVTHAEKCNADKSRTAQQDMGRAKYPPQSQEGKRRAR